MYRLLLVVCAILAGCVQEGGEGGFVGSLKEDNGATLSHVDGTLTEVNGYPQWDMYIQFIHSDGLESVELKYLSCAAFTTSFLDFTNNWTPGQGGLITALTPDTSGAITVTWVKNGKENCETWRYDASLGYFDFADPDNPCQ